MSIEPNSSKNVTINRLDHKQNEQNRSLWDSIYFHAVYIIGTDFMLQLTFHSEVIHFFDKTTKKKPHNISLQLWFIGWNGFT